MDNTRSHHAVGPVRLLLRVEGLLLFAVALVLYAKSGASWGRFAALFFVPDLSFAGYLLGPCVGAASYNALHSTLGPLALAAAGLLGLVPPSLLAIAFIWLGHVGFDRALGYGLKYGNSFSHTHLGQIGSMAGRHARAA